MWIVLKLSCPFVEMWHSMGHIHDNIGGEIEKNVLNDI